MTPGGKPSNSFLCIPNFSKNISKPTHTFSAAWFSGDFSGVNSLLERAGLGVGELGEGLAFDCVFGFGGTLFVGGVEGFNFLEECFLEFGF
ncbi:geranylgeranyl transferase type-2 subunit alpha, putative [Babesia ovata]|uniref:Geranylgeranyl transferase type-2 subunit alpha, putative n=1 Tax=Babesia ovata TaxID=189622 RepID=A0A2H6K8S6_9APIC|nr:geranylgeranyl transferase type-2 subunit alpha, putative [Babesia ovata]GBE59397.1 geranylgeranyl transferase type-2 subunit alpha, putative [Babesia ovata]